MAAEILDLESDSDFSSYVIWTNNAISFFSLKKGLKIFSIKPGGMVLLKSLPLLLLLLLVVFKLF